MTKEQFKQLVDRLNAIEAALFNLDNRNQVRIALNYGKDAPIYCAHPDAYQDTAGWHCPDCGSYDPSKLTPYLFETTGDIICEPHQ